MTKLNQKSRLLIKGAINQLQLSMIDPNPIHALEMARGQISAVIVESNPVAFGGAEDKKPASK